MAFILALEIVGVVGFNLDHIVIIFLQVFESAGLSSSLMYQGSESAEDLETKLFSRPTLVGNKEEGVADLLNTRH